MPTARVAKLVCALFAVFASYALLRSAHQRSVNRFRRQFLLVRRLDIRKRLKTCTNDEFVALLRMGRGQFDDLVDILAPGLVTTDPVTHQHACGAISSWIKVALLLYYFGGGKCLNPAHTRGHDLSGGTLTHVAYAFAMSKATVFSCVNQVMEVAWNSLGESLVPAFRDSDVNRRRAIEFENKFNIPGVVGVVDGSHIPINRVYTGPNDPYYNRKGFFSIILSAVVDANGQFLNIDVGAPGGTHDSAVFLSSDIGQWMLSKEAEECLIRGKQFLLGDSAYKLAWFLMKGYDRRNRVPKRFQHQLGPLNRHICSKLLLTLHLSNVLVHSHSTCAPACAL